METPCNILVVDDDRLVNWVVKEWVEAAGYKAYTAENAVQALELLRSAVPIRVMVTDLRMPIFQGSELIREALKIKSDLDIIIMTGNAVPTDNPGGYEVLEKPFHPTDLKAALSRLCGSNEISN
ncbi:MAG: domain S-box-containing protein [Rhodospirillales bacterium]|nr:domain S-box-containing protein [Rhodospirillales bacterium]